MMTGMRQLLLFLLPLFITLQATINIAARDIISFVILALIGYITMPTVCWILRSGATLALTQVFY